MSHLSECSICNKKHGEARTQEPRVDLINSVPEKAAGRFALTEAMESKPQSTGQPATFMSA